MSVVRPEKTETVIQKKLSPSQSRLTNIDKALETKLHKALAQSAMQLFSLNLQVLDHNTCHECISSITELTKPFMMLGLLERTGVEPGFIAVDQAALAGLVTIQTMGVVLPNLSQNRAATLTDAALIAPFVDRAMQKIDSINTHFGHINQYRFSQMIVDAHRLYLALRSEQFLVHRINLAMGPDQHPAQILIAFPEIEHRSGDIKSAVKEENAPKQKAFLALPAELIAEIRHFQFPWSELSQLKVGTHLILPDAALESIQLRAAKSSHVVSAKLGRLAHFRAVQVAIALPSMGHSPESSNTLPEEVKINAVEPSLFEHDEPQNDADIETLKLDASTEVEQVVMKTTEDTPA